jgi:hypothetical protein
VYHKIPQILRDIHTRRRQEGVVDTDFPAISKFDFLPENKAQGACSYLAVQEGCNNFCTYCVVPYTRGAEYSRPVAEVLKEARRLIATGTLGLTVAVVVVYGVFVITSVVVGILAPRKGYFPTVNAKLIRWGMVAFFLGDVCVGLSMVTGDNHSVLQSVAEIANNIIWWLYVPAQLMLIRATVKPQA